MKRLAWAILPLTLLAQPEKYPPAQEFPKFLFYTLDGKSFTDKDLPKPERGIIVVFFDPHCDHCQKQASFFQKESASLKGIQLMWVSTEAVEALQNFREKYLKGVPSTYVLRDKDFKFDHFFGYSVAPTIYVYDARGKLKKVLREEAPVATILQYL
ncbi:MAG: redoxin domain-containing protein [Bacteroidia bacterium]|nr:redoxin domain-containing protein [Bacteroidia bacterium]MDW8235512.1 redoxin domain-containing protein [Bacteroidia bacterium]